MGVVEIFKIGRWFKKAAATRTSRDAQKSLRDPQRPQREDSVAGDEPAEDLWNNWKKGRSYGKIIIIII